MFLSTCRISKRCGSKSLLSLICCSQSYSLWSMTKDRDLELALSRNRRWIVNNQIKNIIMRSPGHVVSVKDLQKKFKTLDCQGKALNWVRKYPCCFDVFIEGDTYFCRLSKQILSLVKEEEEAREMQEPALVQRLAKVLMMSSNHKLNVVKLNELKRNFGLPDDYIVRFVLNHPDLFRLVNHCGRRGTMEIELLTWNSEWAVSAIEAMAIEQGRDACFSCSLPPTWVKSIEKFHDFNSTPYISPYNSPSGLSEGTKEMEKRTVGLVHELLSLTLWKKVSIEKLSHFRKEFILPLKPNVLLLKHPGIFYVSNRYKIYTVLLREAYCCSELIDKDPLVVVKDKFGDLMQGGLHERNRRNFEANLEKTRKKGITANMVRKNKDQFVEISSEGNAKTEGFFNPEERKRFYKALLGDDP